MGAYMASCRPVTRLNQVSRDAIVRTLPPSPQQGKPATPKRKVRTVRPHSHTASHLGHQSFQPIFIKAFSRAAFLLPTRGSASDKPRASQRVLEPPPRSLPRAPAFFHRVAERIASMAAG